MKRTTSFVLLVVVGAWCALSATLSKDIITVLEKVDKTNASYKTVKAPIEVVMKMGPMSVSTKGELWIDNQTGRFKVNLDTGPMQMLMVYDGETFWNYDVANKIYAKQQVSKEDMEEMSFAIFPAIIAFSSSYKKSFTSEDFARTLEKASLSRTTLDKKNVLLVTFVNKGDNSQIKLWVDAKEYRILQLGITAPSGEGEVEAIFKVVSFQPNVSFPEDAFKFIPPAEAKEYTAPQGGALEGQIAPDFSLESLDGKGYSLSALKGKLVLIDFWATWCGPCKEELPLIEKLHQEFKDKGLVVLGINNEEKATVEKFVKENNITFPILMDSQWKVSESYDVSAIPRVFLIDKEGKIVKDILGYSPENEKILREAIEKLLSE